MVCVLSGVASAMPLRLEYELTDLGSGIYDYDFTLVLDNNDSRWLPVMEWDWIVFGANDFHDSYPSFDNDGNGPARSDWTTTSFSHPISSVSTSGGGVNGPTLYIGPSPALPGWRPTALGESLSWSGTSQIFLPDGELYWSSVAASHQDHPFNWTFHLAHQTNVPDVPEPASLLLVGAGVAILAARRGTRS
jgi:hypothetical protein